jgi:signal transduction histidine kinase
MPPSTLHLLESAAQFGRSATARTELPLLCQQAVELVQTELDADFASFLELKPDGSSQFRAGFGSQPDEPDNAAAEVTPESPMGQVLRSQAPLVIDDCRQTAEFGDSPLLREKGVTSTLLVPLVGRSRPLGVLGAHCRQARRFMADEIAWLQIIANVLAGRFDSQGERSREHDEQMLRGEQMMAIGQVAAGVAHELRNPLTSIKGLVQLNLRESEARGMPNEDLAIIEHEIRRMERTLQTFLDFARPPKPERRMHDLGAIVARVIAVVGGRAKKQHVEIQVAGPETPIQVFADQDQIQQLLLNLALNALDVLPQGGVIEFALQAAQDGFASLTLRDNGPGIAPHILPKVFETFVSNKETGVGLGLPLSRRIAEEHGGTLTAYNLPGSGACFLLRLPAASPGG